MNGPPFLVTLGLDADSFARLDALRDRYFPPDRNIVPAHVSLFHHLPPEEDDAIRAALDAVARRTTAFPVAIGGLFRLGGGFAARVESPDLTSVRSDLARGFAPWLTPQDRQPFRPHITLMNKADRDAARRAFAEAGAIWSPWEAVGESLRLWRYVGGPWKPVERYPFRPDSSL